MSQTPETPTTTPLDGAIALLFDKVRRGYTLYGIICAFVEAGILEVTEGTRQGNFGNGTIRSFADLLRYLTQDPSDEFGPLLCQESWVKINPRGCTMAAMVKQSKLDAQADPDAEPMTPEAIAEVALALSDGARTVLDVYKRYVQAKQEQTPELPPDEDGDN